MATVGNNGADPVTGAPPRPAGPGLYLHWEGRRNYRTRMPAPRVLEPVAELSIGDSDNRVIEGDNLQVMVSLRSQYQSAVDIAYIDAPYNTGKNDFAYSDRRYRDPNADADDMVYVNNEDGGKHTKWLNYMGPRVWLVWQLLAEHGICLVSINDVELFRIGLLLDEIFGEKNRLGILVWKQAADNNPTRIAVGHEYILAYAKRIESVPNVWEGGSPGQRWLQATYGRLKEQYTDDIPAIQAAYRQAIKDQVEAYKEAANQGDESDVVELGDLARYDLVDERGPYAANRTTENPRLPGYFYDVVNPSTRKTHARPGRGYRYPEETMARMQAEDRIIYPDDPRRLVQIKKYLAELRPPLRGIIEIGSRGGAADLKRLLSKEDADRFPNPKPTSLLELLLDFAGDSESLVLDPFAGSGTTAHAVMRLNSRDGGHRRFILIEEGSRSDKYARTLIVPRLKAAIEKEGLRGGFTFETMGRRLDRDAIVNLEREAITNLIMQTDVTGRGGGLRKVDGEYVIAQNPRLEAICLCWGGRSKSTVTRAMLGAMYGEAKQLGLRRPLRVYASTCEVGETESFRFCQIPDEILAALQLDDEAEVPEEDVEVIERLEAATLSGADGER